MKKFFQEIWTSIIKIVGVFFFLLFWPFIILFTWIKTIFSDKTSDSTKVSVTKEVIAIFTLAIVVGLIYYFSGQL